MIEELTPAQIAAMPRYRDMWIEHGLCTDTVDREKAARVVRDVYTSAGLTPPGEIIFADGPKHAVSLFRERFPQASWGDFSSGIIYGCHDADWAGYIDFFQKEVGLDLSKANALIELAKTTGWVWVSADLAIVMDRPSHIRMDENNVLHAEDRPAVLYRDGFAVYSWHGQRVPRDWIMDKASLTPAMALGQTNIEMRRAACEIIGWVNILEQLNYKVIEQDEDPMIGTLVEVDLPDAGEEKFLMVRCGTGRDFAIPVPPDMKTALEANSWTYGLRPEELRDLEVRT